MTAVPRSFTARPRRSLPSALLLGAVFAGPAADALAQQIHWGERPTIQERRRPGIAYDISRGRMILFGGTPSRGSTFTGNHLIDLWEWDTIGWTRRSTTGGPPQYHTARNMVVDPVTREIILVIPAATTMQTHVWGGVGFALRNPPTIPTFRDFFATAFDEERRRVVLWGGSDPNPQVDVYEYDGTTWHQIGASGPEGRRDHALAWDGNRGKVIMFGGRNMSDVSQSDMWEWDGRTWTRITPATLPPARNQHSMVWDPQLRKVVLFGGATALPGTVLDDTWTWDGTNWTRVTTATAPPARAGHAFTYHHGRRKVVICCGETAGNLLADTWEFDGTNWSEVTPHESPPARSDYGMNYDGQRRETILFGGRNLLSQQLGDTWRWRDSRWTQLRPATSPSARYDLAMAYDAARGNIVLFGGLVGAALQNDTWLWDGTTWTQANPAARPPARYQHGMTYDSARQRVVVFGGALLPTGMLNDTWEWDGTNWVQVNAPAPPTARADMGLAFDAARGNVVMVGGRNTINQHLNDTWVYNGTTWTQRVGANLPLARANMGVEYDPIRQLVYAYGGAQAATSFQSTTYSWNGTAWSTVTFPIFPPPPTGRAGIHLAWEDSLRRMVLYGGESLNPSRRSDTYVMSFNPQASVQNVAGSLGCAGGGGPAANVTGFGAPALGNLSFALDLTTPGPPTPSSPVFYFLSLDAGSAMFGSCLLTVNPATLFYTAYRLQGGPVASLPLPIPATLNLLGAQFITQCLYVDPPSALNGLAFSVGARVTIGDF